MLRVEAGAGLGALHQLARNAGLPGTGLAGREETGNLGEKGIHGESP